MKALRITAVLASLCTVLFFASSCGSTEAEDGLPVLGAGIYSSGDAFNAFIAQSIRDFADGILEVTIEDGRNDQSLQMNQVEAMLARGAQVIALSPVETTAAIGIIDRARNAGNIPVIFFNNEPDEATMNSYDYVWFVGSTEEGGFGAQIQGEMVAEYWLANPELDKNGDGVLQIVYLMGDPGHSAARPRADAVKEAIENAGIEIEVLAMDTGMWQTANAKDVMDAWISRFGDEIEFIIAANDAMALGALQSIQIAGFNSGEEGSPYIPIIGIDAVPAILTRIESGEVMGSVLQDARAQGELIVQMAYNIVQDRNPLQGLAFEMDERKAIRIPYMPITVDNLYEADEAFRR
ncbi:MAG: galactose ABC transporter substrate-binding protein [Defluviitaleaceae bacterium]|nr:galactose ABC transporter substrate-binding protein [Defluviitaleaceae bacterium]